jgi:hypothetical protein
MAVSGGYRMAFLSTYRQLTLTIQKKKKKKKEGKMIFVRKYIEA